MMYLYFLLLLFGSAYSIPRDELFPFGVLAGDDLLDVGDDISTEEIQLETDIAFYEDYFSSLYINVNGIISFGEDLPDYKSDLVIPNGRVKLLAPFLADVDTRLSGNVYYRETQDPSMLHKAKHMVRQKFLDRHQRFKPRSLFIVTWDEVGYWDQGYDRTNTFQVVIASDGQDTYVAYMYPDDGINWISSDGKHGSKNQEVPAQIGFDGGVNGQFYTLDISGNHKVENVAKKSNVAIDGLYMFHIGNTLGRNIGLPSGERRVVNDPTPTVISCSSGGRDLCDENARCNDYPSGFCCQCNEPYIGNGRNCLKTDLPQRVNGKVNGNINGVAISDEDLHAYIVTNDGRVYTAISRVPPVIGHSMQSLWAIGGVLGWLFAKHSTPQGRNGFTMTGGGLNRTATVRFQGTGEQVSIQQEVVSSDAQGYMRMSTTINGNVPSIPAGAELHVEDSKEEYNKNSLGIIKSYATHKYLVDNVPYRFTIDQTIHFNECGHQQSGEEESQRLIISRPFMVYGDAEEIVRYATTNKIAPLSGGGDPCQDLDMECDPNAQCQPSGNSHRCVCNRGFYGVGLKGRCLDENECALRSHDCDDNAECINTEGSFECRCREGYRGDGKSCTRDETCEDLVCDTNAGCEYDAQTREPTCVCNPGYTGDGIVCRRVDYQQCNVINNCGANAQCLYEEGYGYKCSCSPGYSGDGFICRRDTCDIVNNCDSNAQCVYDDATRQYKCQCNAGLTGDGYTCEQAGCNVVDNCDRNAQCVYDFNQRRYICKCDQGYDGDGTYCREKVVTCNEINNCDLNADCLYDQVTGNYQCQCRSGYSGDGYSCRVTDCRRDPPMCDTNARCQQQGFDYICVCNDGYEGDGFSCKASGSLTSYLLMAQGMNIMELPFNPSDSNQGKPTIYVPGQTAIGVDMDCYSRFFFWTDVSGKTISKARLDGTDSEVIVSGLGSPEGVAVDWVGRNIYWTDSALDRIEVSNVDGSNRKTLFDTNLVNPRAIVVDPIKGYIFWSDWNRDDPKIERSNMDGTDRKVLVDTELGLPNGLTLDYQQQRLCWADAGTHMIECIDYTGRGRRVIYDQAGWAFDLVLANNKFYWTDWDQKMLPNINEYSTTPNQAFALPPGGNGRVYGITQVRDQCPSGVNACSLNNGGCRFLCLPTPNGGRSCACPDDIDEEECNRIALL